MQSKSSQAQPKWTPLGNSLYVKTLATGERRYRGRLPGRRSWTPLPQSVDGTQAAKQWWNRELGKPVVSRTVASRARFYDYAKERIETRPKVRESTRQTYLGLLEHSLSYLHHMLVNEITPEHMAEQIRRLNEAGKSPSTIHGATSVASSIFKFAIWQNIIVENPVAGLLPEHRVERVSLKQVNHFTREQFETFYAACDEPLKSIVACAVCLGLRISEVLGLVWGDIDFEKKNVSITMQKGRAQSTERVEVKSRSSIVDLPSVLRKPLIERKLGTPVTHADDYVFVTKNGTPYSQRNVARMFRNTMIRSGINTEDTPPAQRLTFHALRKTFTSAVVERSDVRDIERVSGQLRHGTKAMTLELYTRTFDAEAGKGKTGAAVDDAFGAILSG